MAGHTLTLQKLCQGAAQRDGGDQRRWGVAERVQGWEVALGELELSVPPDVREPTIQAARACEQWAETQAKRLFDEELGSDSREG